MSCFVVSEHVIASMVSAAVWWSDVERPFHWQAEGGPLKRIPGDTADAAGQMLWDANLRAYRKVYGLDEFENERTYVHRQVEGVPPPLYVLRCVSVYSYQTSDLREEWQLSEANGFCDALIEWSLDKLELVGRYRPEAWRKLPGYDLLNPELGGATSWMQWHSQASTLRRAAR